MAVCRSFAIDRTAQIKLVDDGTRTQVEHLVYRCLDVRCRNDARAKRIDHYGNRTRNTNGIGNLNLATRCQTGGNHILGNPTSSIGSRAVNLCAVLAREGATAVTPHTAIGVDDDLAASKTRIAHRATHHKTTGRVHIQFQIVCDRYPLGFKHGIDNIALKRFAQFGRIGFLGVLSGYNHLFNLSRNAVDIANANLGFTVGAQIRHGAIFAHLGKALGQTAGQIMGQRHKGLRLVAGVAKHHALIARTDLVIRINGFTVLRFP